MPGKHVIRLVPGGADPFAKSLVSPAEMQSKWVRRDINYYALGEERFENRAIPRRRYFLSPRLIDWSSKRPPFRMPSMP